MRPKDEETLADVLQSLGLPQVVFQPTPEGTASEHTGTPEGPVTDRRPCRRLQTPHSDILSPPNVSALAPLAAGGGSPPVPMRGLLDLANAASWDLNSMATRTLPSAHPMVAGHGSPPSALPHSGFSNKNPSPKNQQQEQETPSFVAGSVPNCPPLEVDDGIDSSESVIELVDQLSDRAGTLYIRPGGHIRFYGSTSNFNLLETPAINVSMNVHRTIRNDGSELLDRLGINKEVPPEIENHLMNLYFTWQDASFHVVDRTMFDEAKVVWRDKLEDTSYYSEALRNAICALGAAFDPRHHPAFVTFPRSLADFFADRAKALLEIELDSPCVASVQALVLLSAHDIGCGRDARGWLFSGMAMRLSFNLGLHQDLKPYIAKGVVSVAEADLRRMVFWAAYVVEHVWSLYLGQPSRMSTKGVSLDKPSSTNSIAGLPKPWTPYVSPTVTQPYVAMTECVEEVCKYQVLLFEAMSPLSDTLYGGGVIPKNTLQELNAQIVTKLFDWKDSLPIQLRVDLHNREATYLPHVLLLHMQYYQSVIYTYRPWMSRSRSQSSLSRGPDAGHARKMCMDSASAVAQLLRLYEDRYTLRRINIQAVAITFSAALLLVFATVSHYQREREDDMLADLSVCFRSLDELAPAWDTAKRARDFLIMLQRHWERKARANTVAATTAQNTTVGADQQGVYGSARKRQRMFGRNGSSNGGDGTGGGSILSPPMCFHDELGAPSSASFLPREEDWGGNGMGSFGGFDLDFDWMLTTSIEDMPGNWGSVFPVPSSTVALG
ncbi:Transcription factor [Niveomyces insectorum RCEF 264]|uniref:Transcription factor n=1 Tax=Niveomyces insectorum RCEF 264 TaxID=1081102 RepID=A0A167W8B8_9HYPO|nr:Transcription factor [Niveomyces insectorum RCEF 264]